MRQAPGAVSSSRPVQTKSHDVVIIGAGHNGLALGCYLARAGLDVAVLERRAEFGGGLSTEEATIPGFSHNLHSNFHGAMPFFPPYVDFDLESWGVRYVHPEANLGLPLADGRALVLYVDELRAYEEIARFSKHDAEAWMETRGIILSNIEELLNFAFTPPHPDPRAQGVAMDMLAEWFGRDVREMSALEFVKSRFDDPHVQALLLFHMAVGGWDVREPKLAPLAVAFLGYATNWQLCRGGSHHLAHVLGGVLLRAGGDLREMAHVTRIRLSDGRATGVDLSDGSRLDAKMAVVSTVDPHQTFLEMVDEADLPDGFADRIRAIEYGHGDVLFGVHLALSEPPAYTAAAFNADIDRTFNVNIGYETPEDLIEHYEQIDRNELPETPRLEVGVNTLFDPWQAPPGKHTAVLWQFVPFSPGSDDPSVWAKLEAEYTARCIAAWRRYAPNMTEDKVLGVYAHTPHDVQRKLVNMRRGGFHSAAVLGNQVFRDRPIAELGRMRTPIDGLYLGGAAVHPHGGILAGPAYNCLQVLADDFDLWGRLKLAEKIWTPGAKLWRERLAARGIER